MNILGIYGPGPNSSSCLLINGKLVSLIEEERLNRIKTSPHGLPILSAKKCLEIGNIDINQIDYIALGWDCIRYKKFLEKQNKKLKKGSRNYLFNSHLLKEYDPKLIQEQLKISFNNEIKNQLPEIVFLSHHDSHAASAIFCTPFKESNILTIDGSGEDLCTVIYEYKNKKLKRLKEFKLPHTLGGFYATFTEFLGFIPNVDEGKVMGLAAYGSYSEKIQSKLDKVLKLDLKNSNYIINNKMRYSGKHSYGLKFTDQFVRLFGKKRAKNVSPLNKNFADLAFNVQKRLEDTVLMLAKYAYSKNKIKNFCIAGGVGMNCKMNGEILRSNFVENLFIQPASADNGVSLGAALLLNYKKNKIKRIKLNNLYYGPKYSDKTIKEILQKKKINFIKSNNPEKILAKMIYEKSIIARFDGRMEFGARSLGNRSILANPFFKDIREYVNLKVKNRESWRPFCPSVIEEDFEKIFLGKYKPKFMTVAIHIKDEFKKVLPSCVHEDNTVRVQVVEKNANPKYWKLLNEFKKLSGYGILINTSFNVQGEPIVCKPEDALRTFYSSGIDTLSIGQYLINK